MNNINIDARKIAAISVILASIFIGLSLAFEQPLYARDTLPRSIGDLGVEGSFRTSEFTGAFVYDHKIEVPPGTNGLTPQLSIFYVSQKTSGVPTGLGTGWDITQTYIERDINGSINSTDDKFRLLIEGNSYDLIYSPADNKYHTKIENFINIELKSGGNNSKNQYWIVKEKNGKSYRLGFNNESEAVSRAGNYTSKWYVDLITDTYDNSIFYTYNEDPYTGDSNATYLNNISYNNDRKRSIIFTYEASNRPDVWNTYQQGNLVKYYRRLSEISVTADSNLVRKYVMNYTAINTTVNSSTRTVLSAIMFFGSDGSTSLPPTIFEYYTPISGFAEAAQLGMPYCFVNSTGGDVGTRFMDANGDGLLDIIRSYANDGNCETSTNSTKKALINNGSGWTENTGWEPPRCFAMTTSNETGVRLADVNGDGLTDIVRSYRSTPGDCTDADIEWALINNGTGWTVDSRWIPPYCFSRQDKDVGARFAEVNGDGLIDIIVSQADTGSCDNPTTPTKKVYLNNGSGWTEDTSRDIIYCITESGGFDMGVRVIDVNGDGLDDIVRSHLTSGGNCESPDKKWALINNGSGWVQDSKWTPPYCFVASNNADMGVRLIDVDGDSLVDIIRGHQNGIGDCDDANFKKAFINNGNGWTENASWEPPYCFVGNTGTDIGARVADINADGLADIIRAQATPTSCEVLSVGRVFENRGNQSYLLKKIRNIQGGETSIEYKKSNSLNNTGNDTSGDLGFNLWVVSRITRSNGMSGSANVTFTYTYNYSGGLYDYPDKEFRGFNSSQEIRPDGSKIVHYFYQDDAKAGREYRTEVFNSSNNALYQRKVFIWNHTVTANKTFVTQLRAEETYAFDSQAGNPRITNISYSYDGFGNVLQRNFSGNVNLSGDEKYETFQYVHNTTEWIVDKPIRYLLVSTNNTLIKEVNYSYDNRPQGSIPLNGSLTRKVESISKGKTAITLYGYNSKGNMINTTDPNNRTTNFTYGINDTTFTYVDAETNAKGHTTHYRYDLGLGKIILINNSNNFVTNYTYDALGRITKEIRPFDSSTYPTNQYTYETDGIAPESTKIMQREQSGASSTFDTFQFTDGLGNIIQTKKESNSSKQIVIDTVYDGVGRIATRSNPYKSNAQDAYTQPVGTINFTNFTYDSMSRIIRIANPDGTQKTFNYTKWNVTVTDENGNKRINTLDAYGQIAQVYEIDGQNQYKTNYTYDTMGNLIKIIDSQNKTFTFAYDMLGRKTTMSDPDMGVWRYTYDSVGNLLQQKDGRNKTTDFQYDEINRLIWRSSSDGFTNFTYDTGKNGVLSRVRFATSDTNLTYDERLRLTKETETSDNKSFSTNYTYDAMDRISTIFLPDGKAINYTYSGQNVARSVDGFLADETHSELDLPERRIYNSTVDTNFTYDTYNLRLTRIVTSNAQNLSYTYDNASNVVQITDSRNDIIYRMAYDALNRLIIANRTDGAALTYFFNYTYNSIGNILKIVTIGSNMTYTYGQSPVHAPSTLDMPGTTNLTIQVRTLNDTYFRNEKVNLTDPPTSWDVFFNETGSITCTKTAGCVGLSLFFTPTQTGTYTILSTATVLSSSTIPDISVNLTINDTYSSVNTLNGNSSGNPTLAYTYLDPAGTTTWSPFIGIKQLNLTAGKQYNTTMLLGTTSSTGGVTITGGRILVFNANVSYYAERDARTTCCSGNTNDFYMMDNNFTVNQAGDHVVLWTTAMDYSALSVRARAVVRWDGAAISSIFNINGSTVTDVNERKQHGGMSIESFSAGPHKLNMSVARTDLTGATIGTQFSRILVIPIGIFPNNYFASNNVSTTTNAPVAIVNNSYTPTANAFHIKIASFGSQSQDSTGDRINVTVWNESDGRRMFIVQHDGDGETVNFHQNLAFWFGNLSGAQKDEINSTRISGTINMVIRQARLLTLELPTASGDGGGSPGKSTPEENQSKIVNTGGVNENVYLLMKVQYYNTTSGWSDEAIVLNHATPITINASQTIALDTLWNAISWNTSSATHGYGTYRVLAAATDENDTILYSDAGQVVATHNFTFSPVYVSNLTVKYNSSTERIYHFAITSRHNGTLNSVSWTLNTGNGVTSSQLPITLTADETILVYVYHNYASPGSYNIIATATSSGASHSSKIEVAI